MYKEKLLPRAPMVMEKRAATCRLGARGLGE
jgi:hypothetical protein